MQNTKIDGLEPIVKMYQETKDERYFDLIFNAYRSTIQGRALRTSFEYGLEEDDCEDALVMSLWGASKSFDADKGIPFGAYVNIKFVHDLTYLFKIEKRDNHFFGPHTKGDSYEESSSRSSVQMVYLLDDSTDWDSSDCNPQADVEGYVTDEDAVESLLKSIKEEVGETAANVAVLTAAGYSQRDIAKAFNYTPDVPSLKTAQNKWVRWRLDKCKAPAERHYARMGMEIPIQLRA